MLLLQVPVHLGFSVGNISISDMTGVFLFSVKMLMMVPFSVLCKRDLQSFT